MDPFTAISLGITAAAGAAKIVDGVVGAKAARKRLQELENAALPLNAFEALQVNTEQQEIMREELQRMAAGQTEMLQQAGTRAIIGGTGLLNQELREGYRQIAADVGNKIDERNLLIAEEDANIQRVAEARLQGQIKRAGEQFAASKTQAFEGISDLATTAGAFGAMRSEESGEKYGDTEAGRLQAQSDRQLKRTQNFADRTKRRALIAEGLEPGSKGGNLLRRLTGGEVAGKTSKIGRLLSSPFRLIGDLFKRRG